MRRQLKKVFKDEVTILMENVRPELSCSVFFNLMSENFDFRKFLKVFAYSKTFGIKQ